MMMVDRITRSRRGGYRLSASTGLGLTASVQGLPPDNPVSTWEGHSFSPRRARGPAVSAAGPYSLGALPE
jgi:hypothetical protein